LSGGSQVVVGHGRDCCARFSATTVHSLAARDHCQSELQMACQQEEKANIRRSPINNEGLEDQDILEEK
jgi:hypothetical protein